MLIFYNIFNLNYDSHIMFYRLILLPVVGFEVDILNIRDLHIVLNLATYT